MPAAVEGRQGVPQNVLRNPFAQPFALNRVAHGKIENDNFPGEQMLVNLVTNIRGPAGRVIILERLEQPEAGNVGALIIPLQQQVHQHVRVRINPVGPGGGDQFLLESAAPTETTRMPAWW